LPDTEAPNLNMRFLAAGDCRSLPLTTTEFVNFGP
jgi:hypothetical protein